MIVTSNVTLVRGEGAWSAKIELDESSTLEDLHEAIQYAVDFDNDHLYCFYVSRTERSRDKEMFDDENGLVFTRTLKDVFLLPPKRSLFYLFDWGDSWIFKVSLTTRRPHEPLPDVEYPRVVSESGTKPEQYPSDDELDE